MTLTIDTFEDTATVPILSHVFRGPSRREILDIVKAHAIYDAFFRAALYGQSFNGMQLRNQLTWGV